MKFTLKDFLELDTKELFVVNGGTDCSGGNSASYGESNSSSEKESDSLLSEMYGYTQNDGFSVGFTQRGFGTGNINVYTLYDSEGNARDHFYDCDHDGVIDYAKPAR